MLQYIFLGIIQGILEWIPVSSEGFTVLAGSFLELPNLIENSMYLHLGTLLAVLFYFNKDVINILKAFKQFRAEQEYPNLLRFLIISTLFSALLGFPLYLLLQKYLINGTAILALIGIGLLITGFLLGKKEIGKSSANNLNSKDAVLLGLLQGFSIIPGISRSGVTIFGLLARNYKQDTALKVSFLMSIPIVLAANIFLHLSGFVFKAEYLIALLFAFIFGLLTIHVLIKISQKINFRYFCWLFGVLALIGFLVGWV